MNRKGFTLIELMVSFAMLLSLIATLTFMHRQSQLNSSSSNNKIKAILSCQSKMEELTSLSFSQLENLTATNFDQAKGKILIKKLNSDLLNIIITYQYKPNKPLLFLETWRSQY